MCDEERGHDLRFLREDRMWRCVNCGHYPEFYDTENPSRPAIPDWYIHKLLRS